MESCAPAAVAGAAPAGSAGTAATSAGPRPAYVAAGAATFLDELGRRLDHTGVEVAADPFVVGYRTEAALGFLLLAPFLLLAAVQAAVRGDVGILVRALLARLPLAVIVTVGGLSLAGLGVALADEMTTTWLGGPGSSLPRALADLAAATRAATQAVDAFAATVASALVAVGAVVVWMELALRPAALHACLLFLPLTLASAVWPAAVEWVRRLAVVIVTLIFTGFFVVVALTAGFGAIGDASGPLDGLLAGAGVLLVAGAIPFAAAKLLAAIHAPGASTRGASAPTGADTDRHATYLRALEGGGGQGGSVIPVQAPTRAQGGIAPPLRVLTTSTLPSAMPASEAPAHRLAPEAEDAPDEAGEER